MRNNSAATLICHKGRLFLFLVAIAPVQAEDLSGLRPLIAREPKKTNEVTVVLDPPASGSVPSVPLSPPDIIENLDSLPPADADSDVMPDGESPTSKNQGVTVRIEKLQTADGPVDPTEVKLLTPFPAKPLSPAPKGWKLDSSGTAPPFTREVELSPGSTITLNIRPHVLIPETDGATTFPVTEPGFNSSLGYKQTETLGSILSTSVQQLDEDVKQMGQAIDRLQQLLVSLPKPPPPVPEEIVAPVAPPNPKPKRKP